MWWSSRNTLTVPTRRTLGQRRRSLPRRACRQAWVRASRSKPLHFSVDYRYNARAEFWFLPLTAAWLTVGDKNALDNFRDSADSLVIGMGLPHCRQLNPHSAGAGCNCADYQPGDRTKSGVSRDGFARYMIEWRQLSVCRRLKPAQFSIVAKPGSYVLG